MDKIIMKKLNKQGIWFAVLHTVFIFNLAFDFIEFM